MAERRPFWWHSMDVFIYYIEVVYDKGLMHAIIWNSKVGRTVTILFLYENKCNRKVVWNQELIFCSDKRVHKEWLMQTMFVKVQMVKV